MRVDHSMYRTRSTGLCHRNAADKARVKFGPHCPRSRVKCACVSENFDRLFSLQLGAMPGAAATPHPRECKSSVADRMKFRRQEGPKFDRQGLSLGRVANDLAYYYVRTLCHHALDVVLYLFLTKFPLKIDNSADYAGVATQSEQRGAGSRPASAE